MGNVIILPETTQEPLQVIGKRAGICYGATDFSEKTNIKRALDCLRSGHDRVLEFVNVEMILDGYSARVIREWYTHIGGSPTRLQESTRYIDYNNFRYVIPKTVMENDESLKLYTKCMELIGNTMKELEINDIPREDAAMLLPLGMSTRIVDKRNVRNLIEMSHQRLCNRAYSEYRQLMHDILRKLRLYSDEWSFIVDTYMMPKCEYLGKCPEVKSCGYFTEEK